MARRTFFNYFASKEEVLLGDLPQRRERLRAELEIWLIRLEPLAAVWRALTAAAVADNGDPERLFLRARLLEEAPVLMARNLGQYAAFEEKIAVSMAQQLGLDGNADPYPRLVRAARWRSSELPSQHGIGRAGMAILKACSPRHSPI